MKITTSTDHNLVKIIPQQSVLININIKYYIYRNFFFTYCQLLTFCAHCASCQMKLIESLKTKNFFRLNAFLHGRVDLIWCMSHTYSLSHYFRRKIYGIPKFWVKISYSTYTIRTHSCVHCNLHNASHDLAKRDGGYIPISRRE